MDQSKTKGLECCSCQKDQKLQESSSLLIYPTSTINIRTKKVKTTERHIHKHAFQLADKMSLLHHVLMSQNNLFDSLPGFFTNDNGAALMDWKETANAHVFSIDLPGYTKEDVKLQVHGGRVLHISTAEMKEEEEDSKGEKWHCRERVRGGFSRQFSLPENAKVDEIKALMNDGVLTITVPKDRHKKKPKHHTVRVSGVDATDKEEQPPTRLGRFVCCKA